jgi:hypothetical protein
MVIARAAYATTSALRANERLLGAFCLCVGAILYYVTMLDQGQLLGVLIGSVAANQNYLHEFFHDGRHIGGVPCH